MRPVLQAIRRLGIKVLGYLDDFVARPKTAVGLPSTREDCSRTPFAIQKLFDTLGLSRHPDKGEWGGQTLLEHLGLIIDTRRALFIVLPSKVKRLEEFSRSLVGQAHSRACKVFAVDLRRFLGLAVSVQLALPLAQFYCRALYDALAGTHVGRVRLGHRALKDLYWWTKLGREQLGRALWTEDCQVMLQTDACDTGWGAVLGTTPAAGLFQGEEVEEHINLKELKTIRLALLALPPRRLRKLLVRTDSQVVLHVVRKMVSRSKRIRGELHKLQYILDYHRLYLRLEYIPSAFNMWADGLSRRLAGDWHISPHLFRRVEAPFGPHIVDCFAAMHNAKLPRYNAMVADPGCEGMDAFKQPWAGENNFCCARFDLIHRRSNGRKHPW